MDDKKLVKELIAGNKKAFEEFYDKYYLCLYRSAYFLVGNKMDAEDILQDTFITAWNHIGELRSVNSLKTWLYRIMIRKAYRSGERKSKEVPDEYVQDKTDTTMLERGVSSDFTQDISQKNELQQALQMLDIKHREVIVLFYYEEMSISEIAKTLGCFEGTVKSRLSTARRKLRIILQSNDDTFNNLKMEVV
ncbi:RNA polymerase sigma factor [Butyrivibrio sp. INlla14]|uniref:RNA polymerase sigma factor n=1 Tax=Butyrivibrio sp. INlla14 TaxID=1520808 RepID=UPI000876BAF5|nr:RNA polymerase sigma factor [Butyrivibrio sp. INlla14]SCX96705.1 RNA polymerase sigma-70 factor, ECF subfamily [Butyrivibrio sp. INlla14]